MTKLAREVPDLPADVYFDHDECQVLIAYEAKYGKRPAGAPAPTLREAIRMVAELGDRPLPAKFKSNCNYSPGTSHHQTILLTVSSAGVTSPTKRRCGRHQCRPRSLGPGVRRGSSWEASWFEPGDPCAAPVRATSHPPDNDRHTAPLLKQ